jgi:2-aminoethylphosphonate-pyruvate transaminase
LGIEAVLAPQESSAPLRAYRLPGELTYKRPYDELKTKGFVIDAGQPCAGRVDLAKTLFRISTMGNLTTADIERLLTCFAKLR